MKQGKFRSSPRSVRAARGKKRRLPLAFDGGFNFTIALCRASGALSEDKVSWEEVARSEPKQEVTGNTETLVEPWNKGTVCLRLPEGHKKIISVSAERWAETQRWLASTQNHTGFLKCWSTAADQNENQARKSNSLTNWTSFFIFVPFFCQRH